MSLKLNKNLSFIAATCKIFRGRTPVSLVGAPTAPPPQQKLDPESTTPQFPAIN